MYVYVYLHRRHRFDNDFRLLPTVALVAYDTFLSQPISVQVKHVAQQLNHFGEMIIKFPWDLLR